MHTQAAGVQKQIFVNEMARELRASLAWDRKVKNAPEWVSYMWDRKEGSFERCLHSPHRPMGLNYRCDRVLMQMRAEAVKL